MIPQTREQAVELMRKLGWEWDELSPEERAAIRSLYNLDDDRPVCERVSE